MGKQTLRQAASWQHPRCMRSVVVNRPSMTGAWRRLALEALTALGERDATIAATEQSAGAALQAMITDESLTVSEAAQWCAGAIGHREAARLRQLAAQVHNNKPENGSTMAAHIR
jgi:hypothetical protein